MNKEKLDNSKQLRKVLLAYYKEYGVPNAKITAVPDGCYIHTSIETGGHKIFVGLADFNREIDYTLNVYLPETDSRLHETEAA